ncbi:alpha-soluble NSF attachment protein-like [Salvia divinorum]|uniref:Alpha-soluble NSF attachment protein-like n=1 Tax=Salvia divinorum TaxID=28513 RepID=A0ABD1HSY5_SALDI
MGYDVAQGEEFERKAEKKIKGWGMFGSKYEDAADLYQKAANSYKLSKSWDRAASAYIKLASCNLKSDSKHEAATAYVDSANCYKKISPKQAISCLDQAVNLLLEINRLNMAAKYCKIEEVNTSSSQCRQKVAEFSAQLGKYHTAAEIYEQEAGYALSNNLLKYGARGHLLNAGICQLCKGDIIAINKALERYQDLDPTFSRTRECRLLANLAVAFDEEDAAKFTIAVKEFDSITKLDAWKTTLLLRVKEHIKAKELEEDDLT